MCSKLAVVGKSFYFPFRNYVILRDYYRLLLIGVSVGIFAQIRSDAVQKRKDHIKKRKELEAKARAEAES